MAIALEGFQPIYGEARAGWRPCPPTSSPSSSPPTLPTIPNSTSSSPILAPSPSALCSLPKPSMTWDRIGVGGSWSEFVDYLVSSFSSEDAYSGAPPQLIGLGGRTKVRGAILQVSGDADG